MRAMLSTLALSAAMISAPAMAATTIVASSSSLTSIGTFGPGTYNVSTPGTIDLVGDGSFVLDANGKPTTSVTTPSYSYCNPNGCDHDVLLGGAFGKAGAGINLGALAGTIDDGTTYFLLGNGNSFVLTTTATLLALVNDTTYGNNTGSFSTTISAAPEPAAWMLMILGAGVAGGALRRRRATPATA